MINKILEKTGLMDLIFYITAVAFWLFFWFLFNVICRNFKRRELYYIQSAKDLKLYMNGETIIRPKDDLTNKANRLSYEYRRHKN